MNDDDEAFDDELPVDVRALLEDAKTAYSEPENAERALHAALDLAPNSLTLRIAIYTFYFYAKRYEEAILHAEVCLAMAAAALDLPSDWRQVSPESGTFSGFERPQRVYLQSLVALGYCRARLGDHAEAEEILRKAASLDPEDKVKAGQIADVIARGGEDPDEDDDDNSPGRTVT